MYLQIYEYFNTLNLFYDNQYGFRKHHSTEFAALELSDRIINEMDVNKLPINVYMDLSKAFDTLDHQILLHKLSYYGFHGISLELIKSYLLNRTQYVDYDGSISDSLPITCGVPQGSILGPLFFIIYVNDLPYVTNIFKIIIYADDTTLFATLCQNDLSNSPQIDLINRNLSLIYNWLALNKLSLNIAKTKAMIFHTKQRQILNYPDLYIDNSKIEFVKEFNFLGLLFDCNMSWKFHIIMISKKISKTIGILSKLKQYLPKEALLNIYNSLILPYLNYGLLIWNKKSEILVKLQKKALRLINNVKYNAHTAPLFKENTILKLEDMCALHDYAFCYKVYHKLTPQYFINKFLFSSHTEHPYFTRQTSLTRVPAVSHDFARNGISYRYAVIINNMPQIFKEKILTHSFFGFKFFIKLNILNAYSTSCSIGNCYICSQ